MTCEHIRVVPGCPSCDEALAEALAEPRPAPTDGRRRVRTIAEARAAFPTAEQVEPSTQQTLMVLKDRYLQLQPRPNPVALEFAARNRALFGSGQLNAATPEQLWAFITSPTMASPGNLGTFYQGWKANGPEASAASLRQTIEYLLRGPGSEEDRLTEMVQEGTYGVGVVLLTKVLCVMQPERFLALLPYESGNGKGKQDIGRVVFGLDMPPADRTGLSIGRLAYWSNDVLREAVLALPGVPFADLEHAKEFLWEVFSHLQGWPSGFDELPADPLERALDASARELTAGQGHSTDPQAVEKVGMDLVSAFFSPAWTLEHVDREKCGWDITATRGQIRLCIEVKATSSSLPTVFVTANELDKAQGNPDWVMAVVTDALGDRPLLRWYTAADVIGTSQPIVFRARLDPGVGTAEPALPPVTETRCPLPPRPSRLLGAGGGAASLCGEYA